MTLRDKFEAWAITRHFAIHRNGGEQYVNTATHHAWNGWQACDQGGHAWRDAVTEALVVAGIYTAQHDADPRKALADLIAWEVQVALDPAVSKDAAALVERGRAQALEEAIAICEKQGTHEEDMGRSKEAFGCDLCIEVLANLANPKGEPS